MWSKIDNIVYIMVNHGSYTPVTLLSSQHHSHHHQQQEENDQHQPLLHEEDNNSDSSSTDDEYLITKSMNGGINDDNYNSDNGGNNNLRRNRFYLRRRAKRCTRYFIISIGVIVLLLVIYIPIFTNVQRRLISIRGWSYNTSRNITDYIFPNENTALIKPRNICRKNFFLLIVVCSSVENFSMRQTIRETWGNITEFNYSFFHKMHRNNSGQYLDIKELGLRMYADHLNLQNMSQLNDTNLHINDHQNFPVRIVFLIGTSNKNSLNYNETLAKLRLESEQYDDLIQENFVDTYNNLTIKSVMMLKWIINNQCLKHGKFLMKCDDDTFVNIPNLLHVLLGGTVPVLNSTIEDYDPITVNALSPKNRLTQTYNLLIGYKFCGVKPVSDPTSKWYSPLYMYSNDIYPNYLSGSSYLMSFDVIPKLYNASINTLLLHLEDVYLTGICAEKIHLKRRHHPLFLFNHRQNKCSYKGTITQHYLKGDLMRDVYNFVMNTTIICRPPDKYFKVKRLRKRMKSCL